MTENEVDKGRKSPAVLLLISTHCAHCAAALQIVTAMVKQGEIAELNIVNLEQKPEVAEAMGVRAVPWMRIGELVFEGQMTQQAIRDWIDRAGAQDAESGYLSERLVEGDVNQAIAYIRKHPESITLLVELMKDADARINLKLGIGVVFEEFATDPVMDAAVPELLALLKHEDARVRADACHYLSLTGRAELVEKLEPCLSDDDATVREIGRESIAALQDRADSNG
ncbi:MAG TPA: HEAT repeat domain-containing protein [Thiotrichales bacterium]|nr:HEAT repeat domain-containing protein [Thiotrichales bacterium]